MIDVDWWPWGQRSIRTRFQRWMYARQGPWWWGAGTGIKTDLQRISPHELMVWKDTRAILKMAAIYQPFPFRVYASIYGTWIVYVQCFDASKSQRKRTQMSRFWTWGCSNFTHSHSHAACWTVIKRISWSRAWVGTSVSLMCDLCANPRIFQCQWGS